MTALEIAVKALQRIIENDSEDQSKIKTAHNALAAIAAQQVDASNSGVKIDTSAERVDSVNVSQVEQDAARYRWLRDHSEPGICAFYLSVGQAFKGVRFAPETVDTAIDAAIAATKGADKS